MRKGIAVLVVAAVFLLTPPVYGDTPLDVVQSNVSKVFEVLRDFSSRSPGWIPGDPAPAYARLVERLRQRGVAGPLWSYFSMIQRLWPQGMQHQ